DKQLRHRFPGHPPTSRALPLKVTAEDYAAFLDIKQRIQKGQTSLEPELPRLEAIIDRSPKFLDARFQAADVAINLFKSKRDPAFSRLAHSLLAQAGLSATDPRLLRTQFELELADGQSKAAAETLSRLEEIRPDDLQGPMLRANLAAAQGDLKTALTYQKEAVALVSSWTNLLTLAHLEERQGMAQDARRDLNIILDESLGNIVVQERLAELELEFGDPGVAESIYRNLLASSTERAANLRFQANLGAALVLRQWYSEAVDTLSRGLKIDSDDIGINLNLADAKAGLGDKDAAEALYRKVYNRLQADNPKSDGPSYQVIEAQCLAHLGSTLNAVGIIEKLLSRNPDDVTLLPVAALVFTLAGDPRAPSSIQAAIKAGIQPCWFKLPAYDPLIKDPPLKSSWLAPDTEMWLKIRRQITLTDCGQSGGPLGPPSTLRN
ncbi:MAG TPA: tetratricopeptide repeat protein, partial [Thermoanaerobaculia bacterium]